MSTEKLVSTVHDSAQGIVTLTFNRPAAFNALDVGMAMAFEEAVAGLHDTADLRCVVLRGEGRAFMAGGDIGSFAADLDAAPRTLAAILRFMHPAIVNLRALAAPVIAAVNGSAAGAGLSLVMAADYVVAKESSKLVLAYDRLGTVPDCGGSWFLPRIVGRRKAIELMLLGRPLAAAEAMELGIINEVASDDAFDERVAAATGRIAAGPTHAFGLFKGLIDSDLPLAAHLERERLAFMDAATTADFRDAVQAFGDKREPRFTGR